MAPAAALAALPGLPLPSPAFPCPQCPPPCAGAGRSWPYPPCPWTARCSPKAALGGLLPGLESEEVSAAGAQDPEMADAPGALVKLFLTAVRLKIPRPPGAAKVRAPFSSLSVALFWATQREAQPPVLTAQSSFLLAFPPSWPLPKA